MDTEIQTCVKSRITKSNLPITKGKDQVLKFHSHTGLISWQIWMMHCSSHDGGGATEIVKGEVELHSARSKSGSWQNEDNSPLFFTVKPILWGVKWFSYPLSKVKRKRCVYNDWTGSLDWTGLLDWPLDPKEHTKWWGISSRWIYLVYESFQPLIDLSSVTEINQFRQNPTFWP